MNRIQRAFQIQLLEVKQISCFFYSFTAPTTKYQSLYKRRVEIKWLQSLLRMVLPVVGDYEPFSFFLKVICKNLSLLFFSILILSQIAFYKIAILFFENVDFLPDYFSLLQLRIRSFL